MIVDLKPCPFCGGGAYIERFGTRRQSTIYACGSCGCRLETGEEVNHGRTWNTRATPVEQEPVAWMSRNIRPREFCDPSFLYAETAEEVANDQLAWNSEYSEPIPLYTHPAADITDQRIIEIADGISGKIDVKTEW